MTMWKKRLNQWSTRDRKPPTIGRPQFIGTTLEGSLLDGMPTTQEAQAKAGHDVSDDRRDSVIANGKIRRTSNLMKQLPPLDLQVSHLIADVMLLMTTSQISRGDYDDLTQTRPHSEIPSDLSMDTRTTPEMRHDFDPSASVAPLFLGRQYYQDLAPGLSDGTWHRGLREADSSSTLQPDRSAQWAQQVRETRSTASLAPHQPWRGASGQFNMMTPITGSTPAGTGSQVSADGMPNRDEYVGNSGEDQYPTPESLKHGKKLEDSAAFRTPTQQQFRFASGSWEDGVSIGYDVSPWSTPSSRPYPPTSDGDTPARTESYRQRKYFSGSPGFHRQQSAPMRQISSATRTSDGNRTVFEISEPGGRAQQPLTPPMQTQGASSQQQQQQQDSGQSKQSFPRLSRFSWTTAGTGTTFERTPERNATHRPSYSATALHDAQQELTPESQKAASPPSPIMTRRRPVEVSRHLDSEREHPALAHLPNHTKPFIRRKPTPSILSSFSTTSNNSNAVASTSKALPTTPSEQSTHDYVSSLSVSLESLAHRRHNILKLISSHESANFSPKANPMIVDLEARRRTKDQVRGLQEELAEVERERHETGLKLHRAEKRRDQEGPTALWVRRITTV